MIIDKFEICFHDWTPQNGHWTHKGLVTPYGEWVNIGSGNGLLRNGTKPLPEPMLTYHQ